MAIRPHLQRVNERRGRTTAAHTTLPGTGYCTPSEAARILGLSVHTLEKWRRAGYEGIGPKFRMHGRHVRYDPRDLLEWSESRARS
ncbi:helix-turn-helix domain-containing protein [Myceligenerans indicum]|uniref:Helix-turn-helix domain-containing protein n=1 Tax=Myceligenerans indicum TaxID=2593663 RepID=A0ABS1LRC6_9MICO|nr:helix-turn-helix domain-containing protein [Myceligenerans indicum]MBL0888790.1 helix-turn-helix domain-containing protein [Myceligenerans indicum]